MCLLSKKKCHYLTKELCVCLRFAGCVQRFETKAVYLYIFFFLCFPTCEAEIISLHNEKLALSIKRSPVRTSVWRRSIMNAIFRVFLQPLQIPTQQLTPIMLQQDNRLSATKPYLPFYRLANAHAVCSNSPSDKLYWNTLAATFWPSG